MALSNSGPDIGEEVVFKHLFLGTEIQMLGSVERKADGRQTITVLTVSIHDDGAGCWIPLESPCRIEVELKDIVKEATPA